MLAARYGHEACVKLLVTRGAEVNKQNDVGFEAVLQGLFMRFSFQKGATALFLACAKVHVSIALFLLQPQFRVDVNLYVYSTVGP